MIDEEDGVVDDDPPEHYAADEGLDIESGVGDEKGQDDPDRGKRNGDHHDQRVEERLILDCHYHVDQEDREAETEQKLPERLLLLLVIPLDGDIEAFRQRDLPDPFLDVGYGRSDWPKARIGGDVHDPFLVEALDEQRTLAFDDAGDVADRYRTAIGIKESQVEDLIEAEPFRVQGLHENPVFVPGFAEVSGGSPGKNCAKKLRNALHGQFQIGGPAPVDGNQPLRGSGFTAQPNIGDPLDLVDGVPGLLCKLVRKIEVVAPDHDLDLVCSSPHPGKEHALG